MIPARIAAKIGPPDERGCWPWLGYIGPNGYGMVAWEGRPTGAHRVVYELVKGPIPVGHELDHTCHNDDPTCPGSDACLHRRCTNPDHTEPVLHVVNAQRGQTGRANREKTHCPRGHAYDRIYRGGRYCRRCQRILGTAWREAQRARA